MFSQHYRDMAELIDRHGVEAKDLIIWSMALDAGPSILFGVIWALIAVFTIRHTAYLLRCLFAGEQLRKAAKVSNSWSECELRRAGELLSENADYISTGVRKLKV